MPGLEAVRYSRRSTHGAERGYCAPHTTFRGPALRPLCHEAACISSIWPIRSP